MHFDKPGCFGHAITYSHKSPACIDCDSSQACALAARQRIEELRPLISVDAIIKMSHKSPQEPTAPQERFDSDLPSAAQALIARIPFSAQRTAAALVRTKINYRLRLLAGDNPIYQQKPFAISVLFDLLLKGPVDRFTYMLALKEKLGHTPATAASQASISFVVTTGLGIAKIVDEKLIIRG